MLPAREEGVGADPLFGPPRLLAVLEGLIADGRFREEGNGGAATGRRVDSHDQKVLGADHRPVPFGA